MKKISWFRRIFWSWEKLENHFLSEETQSGTLKDLNEERKKRNEELSKDKEDLKIKLAEIEKHLTSIIAKNEEKEKTFLSKDQTMNMLKNQITEIKTSLVAEQKESTFIKNELLNKLFILKKIDTRFFGDTGNKGKGELGELQLKIILEKSGLSKNSWVENLIVGKTSVVEFAIKSAEEEKWIPIDAKTIDPKLDEEGKAIIDESYAKKIKTQAKEITKYLSKANTTSFGVLVLQSNSIYTSLYENFPLIFQEIVNEYKILVAAPATFIQTAWSISYILNIYERVKNHNDIYKVMMDTLNNIAHFIDKLNNVKKDFIIAMDKWAPAIENKHEKLRKKMKNEKLKKIKNNMEIKNDK